MPRTLKVVVFEDKDGHYTKLSTEIHAVVGRFLGEVMVLRSRWADVEPAVDGKSAARLVRQHLEAADAIVVDLGLTTNHPVGHLPDSCSACAGGWGGIHTLEKCEEWQCLDRVFINTSYLEDIKMTGGDLLKTLLHFCEKGMGTFAKNLADLGRGGEDLETISNEQYTNLTDKLFGMLHLRQLGYSVSNEVRNKLYLVGRRAVSSRPEPVLIWGKSGSGKERAAEHIHAVGQRMLVLRQRQADLLPLTILNCAALSSELARVELFGAQAGIYTGATSHMLGCVVRAVGCTPGPPNQKRSPHDNSSESYKEWLMTEENKAILAPEGDSAFDLAVVDDAPFGTVFLDEFGELPLQVQAQVLRLIEYGEVQPLGYAGRVKLRDSKGRVHVRFIAATNHEGVRRLVASEDRGGISADGFRHDLVYRVSQWVVELMDLQADEVGSSVGDEGLLLKLERDDSDMKHVRWDAAAVLRLREEVIRGRVPGQRRQLRSIAMRAMAYAVEKEALGYPSELHGGSVVTKEVVEEALRPIRLAQPEAPGKMSPVDELHRCVCEMLRNEFGYEFNVGFEWAQVLRKFRNSRRTLCVAFLRSSQIILPSRGRWTLDELEKAWGNRGSVGAIRAVLKGELQGALKELIPSQGSPNETITWDEAIDLLSGQASESKVTGVSIADGLG